MRTMRCSKIGLVAVAAASTITVISSGLASAAPPTHVSEIKAESAQQATQVTGPGGPTVAVSPNGVNYVYWAGQDGNLWSATGNGITGPMAGPWGLGSGPAAGQAPIGAPTAGIDAAGDTFVYWKGADNNLWESYYLAGQHWFGPVNTGIGPLGSAPTVAVSPNGVNYVYWAGQDGNLWSATGNGITGPMAGPWGLGSGPAAGQAPIGAPTAGIDAAGDTFVYWKGADNNLWESYYLAGQHWFGPVNRGIGPLGSAPTVAVSPNGVNYVYWAGQDGNLWSATGNGITGPMAGPWGLGSGPAAGQAPIGAPTAGIDAAGDTFVYWKGADNNLWESYYLAGQHWFGPVNRLAASPAVSGLRASASSSSTIALSWSYGSLGQTAFNVGSVAVTGAARTYMASGLTPSTTYCFVVTPVLPSGIPGSTKSNICATTLTAVPNVVGGSSAAAQTAILKAGLTVGTVTGGSGNVIGQSPNAGSSVSPGTKVNLTLATPLKGAVEAITSVPVGQAQARPTCTAGAVQYTISGPGISQTWTHTVSGVAASDPAYPTQSSWVCIYSDPALVTVPTGNYQITAANGPWLGSCSKLVGTGTVSANFRYGKDGC